MNKLMLIKGRFMACLMLLCLVVGQSCRKDHYVAYKPDLPHARVNDQAIDKWYSENPISQIIGIDWAKARQTIIDGKHLVRVPTLNTDKIKSVLGAKSMLKQSLLNSNGKIAGTKGKISLEKDPVIDEGGNGQGNTNYYSSHPPEVYFIQDPLTSKVHTYLINFVPDNEATGFGQGGNWTGKLYEWDTKSDTVLVQTFVNNVLTDRSVRVFYHVDENGGIALAKPQKLQSLNPIKDKQVSGIFGWLADKILDGLGAIGYIFGLTELVPSTSSSTGHHYHYRFISHPSSPGSDWVDMGNTGDEFLSLGLPMVSSYLAGMDSGMPLVEVTYTTYDYSGINHTNSGPNNTLPNEDGIYVLEYLTVSPDAQNYILTISAAPLAKVLRDYLHLNGLTEENKAFASWVLDYAYENKLFFEAIKPILITDFASVNTANAPNYKQALILARETYELQASLNNDSFDAMENEWLNTLRNQEGRMEALVNAPTQIRQFSNAAIDGSLIIGIKKTAKGIWSGVDGPTTYPAKLGHFDTNADHGAAILLWEFAKGIGEDVWNFTYHQDVCQKFLSGRVLQEVRSDFYTEIDKGGFSYNQFRSLTEPLKSGLEFSPDHTNIVDSFSKHVNSNWIQFVIGGANIRYLPAEEDGWVEVRVFNNMTRKSLLLHLAEDYPRAGDHNNKPLSNTQQNFKFLMQIDKTKFH